MNDQETLEGLRDILRYAKQDVMDSQERLDTLTSIHNSRLETLRKAQERYMAHLEMMAATREHSHV